MEKIKIIRPFSLFIDMYGRVIFLLLFGIILVDVIVLSIFFIAKTTFDKIIALILFIGLGTLIWYLFKERVYKPEKSFFMYRGSRNTIMKKLMYLSIGGIILSCTIIFYEYTCEGKLTLIPYYIFAIWASVYGIYYAKKSFLVHEDVDFVTSSEVERIAGVEVGEKIQVTYQNFDSSTSKEVQDGANLMIITDKRIYFSFYMYEEWSFLKKNLSEIKKLAVSGDINGRQYLKLLFSDNTSIMLRMVKYGKATSNTTLFFKKFFEVLDAVVLGTVDEKISSRRRVSVNPEAKPIENEQSENKEIRRIDLSDDLIEKLKNAVPIESGRVLEL